MTRTYAPPPTNFIVIYFKKKFGIRQYGDSRLGATGHYYIILLDSLIMINKSVKARSGTKIHTLADPGGAPGTPPRSKFFHFHAVFGKMTTG